MSTSDNTKGWVILIFIVIGIALGVGPFKHAACSSSHTDYSHSHDDDDSTTTTRHSDDEPSFRGGTLRTYKCSNPSCFCKKYEAVGYYNTKCVCGDPKEWHYEFMK